MLHPDTEVTFIDQEIGYGVVAKKKIPKGTITWIQDPLDRVFTSDEVDRLDDIYKAVLDTYTFRNKDGHFVLCWDNGRFINHSFKSNCLSTAYDFEIAIRDIEEGEELTDDYGYLNISTKFKARDEGTRRKYVYPDDVKKYYKTWDKKLDEAIKDTVKVQQPLGRLVGEKLWLLLKDIAKGDRKMDSILNLYYNLE